MGTFRLDPNLRTIKMRKILLLLVLVTLIAIVTAGNRRRRSFGDLNSEISSIRRSSLSRRRRVPRPKRSIQDDGEDIAAFLEEEMNKEAESDIKNLENMFHDLVDEVHDE